MYVTSKTIFGQLETASRRNELTVVDIRIMKRTKIVTS